MSRTFTATVFVFAFVVISAGAQIISARDTAKHLGRWETVCGTITDEYDAQPSGSTDSVRFILFDGYDAFNVVTWYRNHKSVGNLPAVGKLCIKGVVRKHRPEDLVIFERCPKVGVCTYHNGRSVGGTEVVLKTAGSWYVPKKSATSHRRLTNDRYYTNGDGRRVHAPASSLGGVPTSATALCRDGTYSFSQHHRGTCSYHRGVARWLH